MDRNILVLATIHCVQGAKNAPPGKNFDDPRYRVEIDVLFAYYSLDFVFEAACKCGPTITEKLAKVHGLK